MSCLTCFIEMLRLSASHANQRSRSSAPPKPGPDGGTISHCGLRASFDHETRRESFVMVLLGVYLATSFRSVPWPGQRQVLGFGPEMGPNDPIIWHATSGSGCAGGNTTSRRSKPREGPRPDQGGEGEGEGEVAARTVGGCAIDNS
jgi:hypothetical protein